MKKYWVAAWGKENIVFNSSLHTYSEFTLTEELRVKAKAEYWSLLLQNKNIYAGLESQGSQCQMFIGFGYLPIGLPFQT